MITNGMERNDWKVQPDNTVQVVSPHGIKAEETGDESVNWNSILISLGIIVFVGILVTVAAFLLIPLQEPPFYGRRLVLEDLSNKTLTAAPLGAQWLSDNEYVFLSERDGLLLRNIETRTESALIDQFTLQQIRAEEFSVSSDRQYVLLTHDVDKGRLFKRTAKFSIYDLKEHHYNPLKLAKDQVKHPQYQHAQWMRHLTNETLQTKVMKMEMGISSEGKSELVIVFDNNIYYMASPTGPSVQVTEDGAPHEVFNGVPNIMNEEIMKRGSCVWPSPSGDLLAYVSFIDTKVQQIPVIEYGTDGRPNVLSLKYPTVTSPLPEVAVWIAKISAKGFNISWRLTSPLSLPREERYIVAVGWVHDSKIWISEMSRDQGTSHLMTCEGENWECTSVYVNHIQGGISPAVRSVVWFEDWAAFPWPIRTASGWWYNHVALVGQNSKKHPTFKLDGYHVKDVLAADSLQNKIYFLGSDLSQGTEIQQLYSVSPLENSLVCCSCTIGCPKVMAALNQGLTHAIITCIETYLPTMHLINLWNLNESTPLHTQPTLREEIKKLALPISTYKEISVSPSIHASISLSLPPGWTKDDDNLFYPLVIHLLGVENYDQMGMERHLGLQDLLASRYSTAHARVMLWESDSYYHNDSIHTKALQMAEVIRLFLNAVQHAETARNDIAGVQSSRNTSAFLAFKEKIEQLQNLKGLKDISYEARVSMNEDELPFGIRYIYGNVLDFVQNTLEILKMYGEPFCSTAGYADDNVTFFVINKMLHTWNGCTCYTLFEYSRNPTTNYNCTLSRNERVLPFP